MAGNNLDVKQFGRFGVNVDKDPLELGDQELRQATNAIHDPLGVNAGLRKRPGLTAFNTSAFSGTILGGIGVPLKDLTQAGNPLIYLGRGPNS